MDSISAVTQAHPQQQGKTSGAWIRAAASFYAEPERLYISSDMTAAQLVAQVRVASCAPSTVAFAQCTQRHADMQWWAACALGPDTGRSGA